MWKLYEIQISNFIVHKVLLEHSHIHLFMYCLWLLLYYNSTVAATETVCLESLKYLLSGPIKFKSVNFINFISYRQFKEKELNI